MVHSRPILTALPLTLRVGDGRIDAVPRKVMDASSGLIGGVSISLGCITDRYSLGRNRRYRYDKKDVSTRTLRRLLGIGVVLSIHSFGADGGEDQIRNLQIIRDQG